MEDLLQRIHRCSDYGHALFGAKKVDFSEHLYRWHSDVRPYFGNDNFFAARGPLTEADIQAAVDFQKHRGLGYLMLRTWAPLDPSLTEAFGLETEQTLLMALTGSWEHWKENPDLDIRDIQTHDIGADLLDVSDVPEQYRAQARANLELVLEKSKSHPEYHWYCGYAEGQKAAEVYGMCHVGCIEVDDLWVAEPFRNRYFATTLLRHIALTLDGVPYLHADAARTPKDMYAKMGFETLETSWEYYLSW